jgi:hypothetical protein
MTDDTRSKAALLVKQSCPLTGEGHEGCGDPGPRKCKTSTCCEFMAETTELFCCECGRKTEGEE